MTLLMSISIITGINLNSFIFLIVCDMIIYISIYLCIHSIFSFLRKGDLILDVVKRNPLFLHEIEWKNNGFLFTTPNICILNFIYIYIYMYISFTL